MAESSTADRADGE